MKRILFLTLQAWALMDQVYGMGAVKVAIMQVAAADQSDKAPNFSRAQAFCEKANVNCVIVPLPTTRAFTELAANRVQFLMSLDHVPAAESPTKIAKIESVAIIAIARKELQVCDDFDSMTLAAFRNVLYAKKLMEKCPGLKITWTSTYPQAIQMYHSGRVQGVLGVAKNFEQKKGFVPLRPEDVTTQVGVEDVWLFGNEISKKSSEAIKFRSLNLRP